MGRGTRSTLRRKRLGGALQLRSYCSIQRHRKCHGIVLRVKPYNIVLKHQVSMITKSVELPKVRGLRTEGAASIMVRVLVCVWFWAVVMNNFMTVLREHQKIPIAFSRLRRNRALDSLARWNGPQWLKTVEGKREPPRLT